MTIRPVPTLFVECTTTHRSPLNTGIQRVVRNLLRNLPAAAPGFQIVPVSFEDGRPRFVEAASVLEIAKEPKAPTGRFRRRLSRLAGRRFASDLDRFGAVDRSILLLLDSSWDIPLWPAVERFRARGGRVASVIYDLIPLQHPDSSVGGLPPLFRRWLLAQAETSEAFLCISAATAAELDRFMTTIDRRPPITHFRLGADPTPPSATATIRPEFSAIFTAGGPVFLMIGSIEPRKRHGLVLDAFEIYWQRGGTGTLLMIGREAWRSEALLDRIACHPRLGQHLHLIRDADDAALDQAYRQATALIMASEAEGFGLPIVEAFQRGLAVLCSDIPVFREVAGTGAAYFPPDDPEALATLLLAPPKAPRSGPWQSWSDSAAELLAALDRTLRRP
jgi:glycosyltransferase involved in cell wall biosynthesis